MTETDTFTNSIDMLWNGLLVWSGKWNENENDRTWKWETTQRKEFISLKGSSTNSQRSS